MNSTILNLLDLSKETARLALNELIEIDRQEIKEHTYSSDIPREIKAKADIIIENFILSKLIPTGIDILSEERGLLMGSGDSALRFVIDPIDGTVNFIRGISNCCISIALLDGDKVIFGVLASFPDGNIAWGGKEIGSFLGDLKLNVSFIKAEKEGVLCTGFPSRFIFDSVSIQSQIKLMSRFGKTRMIGSASQSLLQVAKGAAECYAESEIMLWDVAAGIAIVEGAGGRVLKRKGLSDYSYNVIADNAKFDITSIHF